MSLPAGFNPNTMSFGGLSNTKPVINIPRNSSAGSPDIDWSFIHRRKSLWARFNDGVASIGNWFADKSSDVLGWMSLATMVIIVITCVVKVVKAWMDDGFVMALLMAVAVCIGGVIACYVAAVVIALAVNIFMYAFRLLFWNGWTLILAIAVVVGCCGYSAYRSLSLAEPVERTEVNVPLPETYRCAASVLNVRACPDMNGRILGTLREGQEVEVSYTENGFGAIEFNGQQGYVCLDYLSKINY